MYGRTITAEVPTTELFIEMIVLRVSCEKHGALKAYPCFEIPISITKGAVRLYNWGVCDHRARKAGFVGEKEEPKPKKFHSQWNRT